ncbi:glycoside hydrolase family 13 protein [Clostridioides difficile]|nr:alpha-glycosidase [Clostridioides difficile]EGT4002313.1 alpha-glycosidase [Clostridioides difficile]MBH6908200.1 alpha-glycosidase [Clostridioides difficile]MBH7983265.1 alpha-glycosidase [Clostridioides difficile]MBH8031891.1 alpha-glycosidase [Clostridioides difficile]
MSNKNKENITLSNQIKGTIQNSLTKESILHIPMSNYAYGYDRETLHIRLRTKKNEAKRVILRIGDQYVWDKGGAGVGNLNASGVGWSGGTNIVMSKEVETELFDYWIAKCKPLNKRSRYGFIIEGQEEKLLFTEKRIIELGNENDEKELCEIGNFFGYPYLNYIDIPKVPNWVKDTVWYQIFPDRFANGDPSINPEGVDKWGAIPTRDNFTGGDLQGVIEHLDYLSDLGINGIYFCPITIGKTNHRYDTVDYMEVDPTLGDKETLKKLIEEAHKRNIKIMLDAVFNHIGYYSKQWQDVVQNKENSRYKNWFYIKDMSKIDTPIEQIDEKNIPYETFGCEKYMPKLNTENSEVIKYLLDVGKYWIQEFDIDAWRLDVSNEVDHVFWRKFREEVKKVKPDIYILGEIWHGSLPWLMGDQFDSVMNYLMSEAMKKFFCTDEINAEEFKYMINDVMVSYPIQVSEVIFNLLGSHDTTRILTYANGNIDRFKLAYMFMFVQTGCPCIYYGDEIGMEGELSSISEGQRKCMEWNEEKWNKDIFDFMKKIIRLRKENKELRSISNEWVLVDKENGTIILKKESISIIINNSSKNIILTLPDYLANKKVKDLYEEEIVDLKEELMLEKYKFIILK